MFDLEFVRGPLHDIALAVMTIVYFIRLYWLTRFVAGKERQAPTGQIRACISGHFHRFTGISTGIVIVDLVYEHIGWWSAEGLPCIDRAKCIRPWSIPDEILILGSNSAQLQ